MQTAEPEAFFEQRSYPQSAILKAARALADRAGVKSVTLARVAAEALLPRSYVCSRFESRMDLLNFVAADSVATLARSVGVVDWRSNESRHDDAPEGAEAKVTRRTCKVSTRRPPSRAARRPMPRSSTHAAAG